MRRELTISSEPIAEQVLFKGRALTVQTGAVISFIGIVRGTEEGKPIAGIEYEAFQQMVEHQFGLLFDQIEQRWPIESVRLVHRVGAVRVGEPSLWVELTAPHREEAFAACQFLIDEMKRVAPIWKKPIL